MNTPTSRRPFLVATATGGLAVAGLAIANRVGLLDHDPNAEQATLQLNSTSSGVRSLEFPLGEDVLPATGNGQWRTGQLPTSTHSMVAVTWQEGEVVPTVEISSRNGGRWADWQRLLPLHDLPDATEAEGNGRTGTDLAWVGPADGVRVRVRGRRPEAIRLVLLHPSREAALSGRAPSRRAVPTEELRPELMTRRDWGANPAWRSGSVSYNETIEQVHVHHTVNSNDYAAADVPGLIRGMYSYHTQSLGWSDIAYNFLVDRFGRTWVGRAGGPGKPVRGAHTLGFNATSTGVAAIGNYETATPSSAVISAISQLAAWKLAPYGRNPEGRIAVASEGSDRYRTGTRPRLHVIDGHRDTNDTACPGSNLYAALPTIRRRAAAALSGGNAVEVTVEPVLRGELAVDETLTIVPGSTQPPPALVRYQWRRNGTVIDGATAASYRTTTTDVGSIVSAVVTYSSAGSQATQRTLSAAGPIRARPSIEVTATGSRRGVVVTVTVTAAGAQAAASGAVVIALPKRERSVVMTGGRVRVRLRRPLMRARPLSVRYAGNSEILPGAVNTSVVITSAGDQ